MSDASSNPRSVANTPITKSYLGILRVGNNIDLSNGISDTLLDPTYYTDNTSNTWVGTGTNSTRSFIDKESPNARYGYRDAYSNLKLPVTDSVGHFLNFALGIEETEIGKFPSTGAIRDCVDQFNDEDTITFATVDTNDYITIGLSGRDLESAKKFNGASLTIDNATDYPATLVVNNYYHHKLVNNADSISKNTSQYNLRTIIKDKETYKKYDAFIYNQENFKLAGNNKDCIISIDNIKNYVNNRLVNYVNDNKRELPAGTIVSQYCSLDKWYCLNNKGEIDEASWQGYRPAMYKADAPFTYWNNIQGRAFRGDQFLYYDGFTADQLTTEAAPDFKRGYLLCNGESYTIELIPKYIQTGEIAHKTVDLFSDLFYVLGHYYQNDERQGSSGREYYTPPMRKVVRGNTDSAGNLTYSFENITMENLSESDVIYSKAEPVKVTTNNNCPKDYNTLYCRDMAILTAFKVIDDFIATDLLNIYNTKESIIEWLSGQQIPDQYIFNAYCPDFAETVGGVTTYPFKNIIEYTTALKETIKIDIGKEINNFMDEIPYYTYTNGGYSKIKTRICDMAEVQFMAELFAKRHPESFWKHMSIVFYLPKLYTSTDTEVNIGESYRLYDTLIDTPPEKTVGLFPGSNALTLSTNVYLAHRDSSMQIDTKVQSQSFTCNYNFNPALEPHAHAVMLGAGKTYDASQGKLKYAWDSYGYVPADKDIDSSKYRIKTFDSSDIAREGNVLKQDIEPKFVAAADYHSSIEGGNAAHFKTDEQMNYIFQENDNATLKTVYNSYSGQHGYEYALDGFKWYGATSSPLWYKNTAISSSNYAKYKSDNSDFQGYFRPESIKVLPLIKL